MVYTTDALGCSISSWLHYFPNVTRNFRAFLIVGKGFTTDLRFP